MKPAIFAVIGLTLIVPPFPWGMLLTLVGIALISVNMRREVERRHQ
jgi:hypothetical protein